MRELSRKIAHSFLVLLAIALFVVTISSATHKDAWIPESIRDSLHIGDEPANAFDFKVVSGPVGPVGPVGPQGEKGEPGNVGARGVQGDVGPVGPVGRSGQRGKQGAKGEVGARGDRGEAGPVGLTGSQGAQGEQGAAGPQGATGPQGAAGPQGATGPQGVAGPQGATGAVGPVGPVGPTGATGAPGLLQGIYGSYLDTTTQLNTTPGQPIAMQLNTVVSQRQVTIANGSKVTVGVNGAYNIAFSAQMFHTANEASTAEIWLRVNGNDVPDSNTQFTFDRKDDKYVAAWNFMVNLNANDFVQLMWFSNDSTVQISYSGVGAAPVRPAIPSLILTINQVG